MQARFSALALALARFARPQAPSSGLPRAAAAAVGPVLAKADYIFGRIGCFEESSSRRAIATAAAAAVSRDRERALWKGGFPRVAGVDESGTGAVAGPLVAAACVLPEGFDTAGVKDSKKLSRRRREELFEHITTTPGVTYAVAVVNREVIDGVNTGHATLRAMQEAVAGLALTPAYVLIDGMHVPEHLSHQGWDGGAIRAEAVVKGDAREACIAAASIIATATHDRLMDALDDEYPEYGFAEHHGYPFPQHKEAIRLHGPCAEHRRSYKCVKALCKERLDAP